MSGSTGWWEACSQMPTVPFLKQSRKVFLEDGADLVEHVDEGVGEVWLGGWSRVELI